MTWQNSILFSSQGIFDMHGIPVFRHGPAGNGNPHFLQFLGNEPVTERFLFFLLLYDLLNAAFNIICRILLLPVTWNPHREENAIHGAGRGSCERTFCENLDTEDYFRRKPAPEPDDGNGI